MRRTADQQSTVRLRFTGDLRDHAAAPERHAWADVAKGACIVLVVLWHVIMKHYLQVDWRISLPFPGIWGTLGEQLLPLRMPLFFAISGLFAARAVARPWRVLGRTKLAKFYYLYVVWLVVHTALLSLVPDFDTARATGPHEFFRQLTIDPSNLWYLYALALYFAVAKLTRRVPAPVVLVAAFALSAAASAELIPLPGDREGVYQNLVFFLAGLHGKPIVERVAATAGWLRFFAIAVPYLGVLALIQHFDAKTWFGLWPAASFIAVFLGVTAAGLVTRWSALTGALAGLGRRTLPIYVVHMPLLALLHLALVDVLSRADPTAQTVLATIEPAVLTAVVVALCLLIHRFLPTKWIFDLPAPAKPSPLPPTGGSRPGRRPR
ncbi:acyltransferase family protein [Saccharopolyspora indica]|uniref:acyltransferase family protein n=1 Tax=Saccharopolyspora indica TaxID=1229659 RepID=UPI0022EABB0C|nr:acyltransferase family protein [Saccharopolyspora indica]MDA3645902.1 acyltransferase family protein [Saccharopolyspora indica]